MPAQVHTVYLLQNSARTKIYIGYSPDVQRRLRKHNGLLPGGAKATLQGRPWKLLLTVHGFEMKNAALQFEWAWQHPEVRALLCTCSLYASFLCSCTLARRCLWCRCSLQVAWKAGRSWQPRARPRSVVASVEALAGLLQVDSFGTALLDVTVHDLPVSTRSPRLRRALDLVRDRVDSLLD